MAWVKMRSYPKYARLIDFSISGGMSCDVSFLLSDENGRFRINIRKSNNAYMTNSPSTRSLILNTWEHVAINFDGTLASLYLNGEYDISYQSYAPCSVVVIMHII